LGAIPGVARTPDLLAGPTLLEPADLTYLTEAYCDHPVDGFGGVKGDFKAPMGVE